MSPPQWKVELLGRLRVSRDGTSLTRFRTHKTAALFGYLAYHSSRPHPREAVAELIWSDDDFETARRKLTVALSWLRQQLEPEGIPVGKVLQGSRSTIQLNPEAISLDFRDFENLVAQAERETRANHRVPLLEKAADCYGGSLLPGFFEDWIPAEQQRLECLYLSTLRQLIHLAKSTRPEAVAQYCLRSLAVDPIQEEIHRHLMLAYAQMGQSVLAQRQFRELERLLRVEMCCNPDKETLELFEKISHGRIQTLSLPEEAITVSADFPIDEGEAVEATVLSLESPAGLAGVATFPDSELYVTRAADARFSDGLNRRESILLLKGPSQVGKTSLLARGLQLARDTGARVAYTDLQLINSVQMISANEFLMALARYIREQLESSVVPSESWVAEDGPNHNFRRFIRRVLNEEPQRQVIWGIDAVDRLRSYPFGTEVFALFRSWHNERVFEPSGPWSRLTLAIAYASESNLLIDDPNQSPFNVGTRIELDDFSMDQISDLNARCGVVLQSSSELRQLRDLLGGHPFLIRRALQELRFSGADMARLDRRADHEDWIFGDHLRRLRTLLARRPALENTVRLLATGKGNVDDEHFYQLRSAGYLRGEVPREARFRCELYRRYLSPRIAAK